MLRLAQRILQRRNLPRFRYGAAPLSASAYEALASRPGWSATSLELEPHVAVRGLVRPPARPDAPVILYFPGNSDTQLRESQDFLDGLLAGREEGALVHTYRGFDGSQGKSTWKRILRDADRVFSAQTVPLSRLHVVGFSLGTLSAVKVLPRRPASVTLLAPFTKVHMLGASPLRRIWPEVYDLPAVAHAVPGVPLLVMHGAADTGLPPHMGREIASLLHARYIEVADADHTGLLASEITRNAIRDVLG